MKFQQGDKVILLHSGEEAEIIDFINREMALVVVNGVKFPVYLDQLDFPYFKRFTAKPELQPKKKIYIDEVRKEKTSAIAAYKVGEGLWLSFLPVYDKDVFDDDIVEYFRLYLVNQTSMHLNFIYSLKLAGQIDFELKNDIHPLSDFYLHDVKFEALNDSPRFDFVLTLNKQDKKKAEYVEASLKLKPKQVFARIEESRMKQEASFSYILIEGYPDRLDEEKADLQQLSNAGYKIYEGGRVNHQQLEPARSVLDLHIEKLTDRPGSISKQEMFDLQLKTFEKYYELALMHHFHQMIVIHGVGTGRLRDEIHDILRLKKEVRSFVNQFHPLYGFGATEIYFK
jgi:hypothetical protein